jgi:hypothetical protein
MADEKDDLKSADIEGIQAEEVNAMYYDAGLIEPMYKLRRLNTIRGRIYFRFQDEVNLLEPIFYGGTTNMTSEIPKSEQLIDWYASKGAEWAKRNYYQRMLFGSLEHSMLADYAIFKKLNLDEIPDRVRNYFFTQNFYCTEKELSDMAIEAQMDFIGLSRWMIDYKVQLIAVEIPVFSDVDYMATQIDLVCLIEEDETFEREGYKTPGKRKIPVLALINYKSGKSGFFDTHRFQLESEKNMFLECFPDFAKYKIRTYNLAGKKFRSLKWDGRSRPYAFSDQTDKINVDRYNAYLSLAKITRDERLGKPIRIIKGELSFGGDPLQCVEEKTLKQIVEQNMWQQYVKTSASIPQGQ